MNELQETYATDISLQEAIAAHNGTSFSPEDRGAMIIREYAKEMAADFANLLKYAETDEERALLDSEWARYRPAYAEKVRRWLSAKSRCISSMITGGSNFPVRRAERANNVEHGRLNDMIDFRKRALASIIKKLTPEERPIMAGDQNAPDRLRAEIKALEDYQELMKKTNAAIRANFKNDDNAKTAAIVKATGVSEYEARKVLVPNCFGAIGYADYKLRNNLANLKRLKGRLVQIERNREKPEQEVSNEKTGIAVKDSPAENRVRIFFPGKPDGETIAGLKKRGFRWTPSLGCWQAYRNAWSMEHAKSFIG